MASGMYNRGKLILSDGTLDWSAGVIGIALVTSTYTPDNAHNVIADIDNELTDGSYAQSVLASMSITENDGTDKVDFKATAKTFAGLDGASVPKYAIIFHDDGVSDNLICWIDIGAPAPTPNGSDYIIQWSGAAGVQIVFTLD